MPTCVNCKQNKSSTGRTIEFYTARVVKSGWVPDLRNPNTWATQYDSFQHHTYWLCSECDHELYHALPDRLQKRFRPTMAILFSVCVATFLFLVHASSTKMSILGMDEACGTFLALFAFFTLPVLFFTTWNIRAGHDEKIIEAARATVTGLQEAAVKARKGRSEEDYASLSMEEYRKLKPPSRNDIDKILDGHF